MTFGKEMNPFLLFRLAVVLPLILSGAGVIYALAAQELFSQDWQDLIAWNGDGGILPDDWSGTPLTIWLVIGAFGLISLIALVNQALLFFYWKPSRTIFLVSWVLLYPATLLLGLTILTPVENLLYELSALMTGVTLALAYYSPVAERFRTKETEQGADGDAEKSV
jgi:hypothetical protein